MATKTRRKPDAEQTTANAEPIGDLLDRQPPRDLAAEQSVIGAVFLLGQVDEVADLSVDDFYDPAHQAIWEALLAESASRRIDTMTVVDRLRKLNLLHTVGGMEHLLEIVNAVPTAANVRYYADIVREKSMLRRVIVAGTEMVREAYTAGADATEIVSQAEQSVLGIAERAVRIEEPRTALRLLCETMALLDKRKAGDVGAGLPTGLKNLDAMIGGLRTGTVTILAGRPSMGKTACALGFAIHAALKHDTPTLFISLEMSAEEVGDRLLAHEARVSLHRLREGTYSHDEQRTLVETSNRISQMPLIVDDAPARNMTGIGALARRIKKKHGLGLLVIDYLQLVEPENPRDPRQEQVARISRRCKKLARELNVPLLVLSQLNRTADTAEPRLSHLRESGAIEQDADIVLFVHRPDYYTAAEPKRDGEAEVAKIIVAKQRNGPTGHADVHWFGCYTRYDNPAQEKRYTQTNGGMFDAWNNRGGDDEFR